MLKMTIVRNWNGRMKMPKAVYTRIYVAVVQTCVHGDMCANIDGLTPRQANQLRRALMDEALSRYDYRLPECMDAIGLEARHIASALKSMIKFE